MDLAALSAVAACVREHAPALATQAATVVGGATILFRLISAERTGIKAEGLLGRLADILGALGLNKK